jgi:hypothetical protein
MGDLPGFVTTQRALFTSPFGQKERGTYPFNRVIQVARIYHA